VKFRFGDRERLLLLDDVFAGDRDLRLQRSDADVSRGDVAEQGGQHVVVTGDGGEIGRISGFDAAAELAPEIQFPIDGETQRVAPKVAY